MDEYIPYDNDFGDYAPYDIDPLEFIRLITNAKTICTDSFHGTAFSALMKKEFYSFRRFRTKTKESTNNRIEDFLEKLELKERLITGMENPEEISGKIDYSDVTKQLDKWRCESLSYLKNAVNDYEN